jgi:hypothetical protein
MAVYVALGILVLFCVAAALAQWRNKWIQSDPNFAPSDRVDIDRLGTRMHGVPETTATHHDHDPPEFEMGD